MKKLKLDLESLAVDSFRPEGDDPAAGTVNAHNVAWTWAWSWCDTCAATCDAGVATCGASCGPACQWSVNSPDCYTVSCPAQTYCNVTVCIKWQAQMATSPE